MIPKLNNIFFVCVIKSPAGAQTMPQWHIDYFEIKLLKKWLIQADNFTPLCFPEKQEISLMSEVSCVRLKVEGHHYRQRPGI